MVRHLFIPSVLSNVRIAGEAFVGAVSIREVAMAKSKKREYVWLECKECGDRNYRTEVNVQGGTPKFELVKFCKRERKRTSHKIRRK